MGIVNKSTVEYINHMGNDLSVVNAAKVSFNKESSFENGELNDRDIKLIKYLASHGHWSPFGHVQLQFRFTTPIFIARQLVKHQVGLCWNEVSRRYVSDEPDFYLPEVWRGKPINKKQGSSDEIVDVEQLREFGTNYPKTSEDIESVSTPQEICNLALETYTKMLELGVAPEQARIILPQNMMTSWYWTGSLYAFSRIYNLRSKPDAQKENHEIMDQLNLHIEKIAPVSWKYLTGKQEEK